MFTLVMWWFVGESLGWPMRYLGATLGVVLVQQVLARRERALAREEAV